MRVPSKNCGRRDRRHGFGGRAGDLPALLTWLANGELARPSYLAGEYRYREIPGSGKVRQSDQFHSPGVTVRVFRLACSTAARLGIGSK
jgi:hypothetical protein